ncbi:hypothetical protein [Flavobacterium cerinum]|uniref:Uncharacterized protein n=1 Tax=Flavobacterium cerinum TaxID=2502784 RepID=A0A3S3U331_9FLAO|nr:hypothetical protein [Flavobacterium cerinum]RWX00567.1 hypothetical protein EPI11_09855 [Flavobacterium cerinum]
MRTLDIVIRLNGHQEQMEMTVEKNTNYSTFFNRLQKAIDSQAADIVHKGDYFRYDQHLLPKDDNNFATYILFRDITLNDTDNDQMLWAVLKEYIQTNKFPEVREKNEHHQLIELSSVESIVSNNTTIAEDIEEILIRIPGSRELLEFDPSSSENNKILYDKLVKLIYDKEAEIMYKGPKLIFADNRDLFISPDDFSIYVLFRSKRDFNYENKDLLWSNLTSDLKTHSSITMYRAAKNYQVILFTPDE